MKRSGTKDVKPGKSTAARPVFSMYFLISSAFPLDKSCTIFVRLHDDKPQEWCKKCRFHCIHKISQRRSVALLEGEIFIEAFQWLENISPLSKMPSFGIQHKAKFTCGWRIIKNHSNLGQAFWTSLSCFWLWLEKVLIAHDSRFHAKLMNKWSTLWWFSRYSLNCANCLVVSTQQTS